MADYEPSFYNDNWTVLQKIVYLSNWCKVNTVDINSITFTYTDPDATGKYTVTIAGKNYKGDTVTLGTVPAYKGVKGDKGDTGATGATGAQGAKGDTGAQGVGIASIASETPYISGENMITPVKVTLTDNTQQEFTVIARNGVDGAAGKDGTNFYIVGNLNTAAELPANPPRGESAYLVGETTPRDLYVYDYTTNAWVNEGALQGIKGDTGADGVGIDNIVAVSHSTVGDETVTNLQVNYTEGKAPQTVEVHAQNGAQGEQGAAGKDGKDYLIYTRTATSVTMEAGTGVALNKEYFNREPNLGEYVLISVKYNESWYLAAAVINDIGTPNPNTVTATIDYADSFAPMHQKKYCHTIVAQDNDRTIYVTFLMFTSIGSYMTSEQIREEMIYPVKTYSATGFMNGKIVATIKRDVANNSIVFYEDVGGESPLPDEIISLTDLRFEEI